MLFGEASRGDCGPRARQSQQKYEKPRWSGLLRSYFRSRARLAHAQKPLLDDLFLETVRKLESGGTENSIHRCPDVLLNVSAQGSGQSLSSLFRSSSSSPSGL